MREYPVKKGFPTDYDSIKRKISELGFDVKSEGDLIIASIPGISRIEIKPDKRKILVNTGDYDSDADKLAVVRTYNDFIEKLTGYSAKERKKMMTKD
ncbi:conserved hypothetical protein [Thermoplasma acidophilum]|uniref:DUF5611 domain-containing protein n=1 Tax=Thermoplasma acidophilum (strain ATCC 25905 / DSM 1728 / JCM 9062 / NBRC 15155 / AMRC-C165) TaxID=273075 RepID=Q9HLX9_THEAC|nr:DUF5611 family protein [Thermoplasma acidophilum]CAC11243.1 conserved hypothetical protein [Thermoplasma acidophilum]